MDNHKSLAMTIAKRNRNPVEETGFLYSRLNNEEMRHIAEHVWKEIAIQTKEFVFYQANRNNNADCIGLAAEMAIEELMRGVDEGETLFDQEDVDIPHVWFLLATIHYAKASVLSEPLSPIIEMSVALIEVLAPTIGREEAEQRVLDAHINWLNR